MRLHDPARRRTLQALAALGASAIVPAAADPEGPLERSIPSSGERLRAIGMGTWITFDAGTNPARRSGLAHVLRTFFERGGTLVDSSPMYGSAEAVVGHLLPRIGKPPVFAASKVWIVGQGAGVRQMEDSRRLWDIARFDLMQVHNLVDWEHHLRTLRAWKESGRVRYVGVTTSHGRRHAEVERIVAREPIDFVQVSYSLADRSVERRLLPLAESRGVAVIANRPFDGGLLFEHVRGKPLPGWAPETGCANWAQVFLKFVVAHPAVTCAIPATSRVDHMLENMGALRGPLPDPSLRARMVRDFAAL